VLFDIGNGLACIFPTRQVWQMGSFSFLDSRVIPVTCFCTISLFMLKHLCHSVMSAGSIEIVITSSEWVKVLPSRKAAL